MDAIIEQLRDYCDCLPDLEPESQKYDRMLKNLNELISIISNLTCWSDATEDGSICDTFLMSERREIIDAKEINCCVCDGTILSFSPFYRPFQPDSFKVSLAEVNGLDETVTELDTSDYRYIDSLRELKIDLRNYLSCRQNRCECPSQYRLIITYDAGYSELPECMLQLFCDLMHVMAYKNDCNCKKCTSCKNDNDLTDEGAVDFTEGDTVSPTLNTYWKQLIIDGYKQNLGKISLCGQRISGCAGFVV